MGDGADSWDDAGIWALALHEAGQCDDFCPYCYEEQDKEALEQDL